MPESWIDQHVGDEVRPRAGFEHELESTLRSAWHGDLLPVRPDHRIVVPRSRLRTARIIGWAAAAVVVIVGAIAFVVVRDDRDHPPAAPIDTAPIDTAPSDTTSITGPATTVTNAPTSLPAPPDVTDGPAPTATLPPVTTVFPGGTPTTLEPTVTTTGAPAVASTPEEQTVLDYLGALADGNWEAAAKLLGEGGLEWEARADMRPLFGDDGTLPSLPDALQSWCESGGLCQLPTSIVTMDNRPVGIWTIDGVERYRIFVAGSFEGQPSVRGLPLRVPPGEQIADTVACWDDSVEDSAYADLDGDGWEEIVQVSHFVAEGGSQAYGVLVCGTSLSVTFYGPIDAAGGGEEQIDAIDVDGDGRDELLVSRFDGDVLRAGKLVLDGDRLVPGSPPMEQAVPPTSGATGTSFGCRDDGDGQRLVSYTYRYVGGTDLGNSTAVEYTVVDVPTSDSGSTGEVSSGTLTLPDQEVDAFHLVAGYCGALPIQTY